MNKRKANVTCDEDCFHCIYPDCIMDEEEEEEIVVRPQRKEKLRKKNKKKE